MISRGGRFWLMMAAVLFAIAPAFAQSTKPAAVVVLPAATQPAGQHEKQAIQRQPANAANKTVPGAKPSPISTGMDTTRVVLSLLVVIAAIFLLRWIAQQFFGAPSVKKSSKAVQVLSRSMITPKQHVIVLQVGKRVIVVGDSGTQMNPLCEITDADEVAELVGQLRQDKADPVSRAFGTFFGKAEKDYSAEATDDCPTASAGEDPDLDPALATTKAELSGLIDKVRSVSKRIEQG